MSTFVRYLDEVLIDEAWVIGWQTIDLAPYLNDPSAKAVTLRMTGRSGEPQISIGARGVGDSVIFNEIVTVTPNAYCNTLVSLDGGTSIQIFMDNPPGGNGSIRLTGEVHDDAVIYDEAMIKLTIEAEFNTWVDRQPTPQGADVLADIGAVIVRLWQWNDGTTEVKHPDSANIAQLRSRFGGISWAVVGLDENGFYNTYTSGKTGSDDQYCVFQEVGYLLKTSNVVTIQSRGSPLGVIHDNTWRVLDVSAQVSADAVIAGLRIRNSFTSNRTGFTRAIGSSEVQKRIISPNGGVVTQQTLLNASLEFEYRSNFSFNKFNIEWYEELPSNVPPTITNTPAATAPAGVDYAEQMTASGSDPKAWELTVAPPGAVIGSADGLIAWVPSAAKVGDVYDFTVVVTGPELNTDTLSWQVTVTTPQLTALLKVEPALKAKLEVRPTQTLASKVEPALTGTTKVEIA